MHFVTENTPKLGNGRIYLTLTNGLSFVQQNERKEMLQQNGRLRVHDTLF